MVRGMKRRPSKAQGPGSISGRLLPWPGVRASTSRVNDRISCNLATIVVPASSRSKIAAPPLLAARRLATRARPTPCLTRLRLRPTSRDSQDHRLNSKYAPSSQQAPLSQRTLLGKTHKTQCGHERDLIALRCVGRLTAIASSGTCRAQHSPESVRPLILPRGERGVCTP
jgi:hypothetical protein